MLLYHLFISCLICHIFKAERNVWSQTNYFTLHVQNKLDVSSQLVSIYEIIFQGWTY